MLSHIPDTENMVVHHVRRCLILPNRDDGIILPLREYLNTRPPDKPVHLYLGHEPRRYDTRLLGLQSS